MSLDDNIHQSEKKDRKLVRVGKGLVDILGGALKGGIIFLTAGIVVHSCYLMLPKTIRYTTITEKNYYFDKDEENNKEKIEGTNEYGDFQDKKDKKTNNDETNKKPVYYIMVAPHNNCIIVPEEFYNIAEKGMMLEHVSWGFTPKFWKCNKMKSYEFSQKNTSF